MSPSTARRASPHTGPTILEPLVADHSGRDGALRYRQIEYYRMPLMAYLAVDDPRSLSRNDFVRLGMVTGGSDGAGDANPTLAYAEQRPGEFEPILLRPLLGRRRRRTADALPVQRALARGRRRRGVGVLQLRLSGRAGAVPTPTLPALPDRAPAEGGAADVLRPAGRGAQAARRQRHGERQALQAQHPHELRGASLRFTHRYWFHEISEAGPRACAVPPVRRPPRARPLYAEVRSASAT